MTAPSLTWSPGEFPAEVVKARSIPVPGAVVIAPLTQSWCNYGSAGGEFTRGGNPTISAAGATFDGVDDVAYIDTGYSANFTLISRIKLTSVSTPYPDIISAMIVTSNVGGWGVAVRSTSYWLVSAVGQSPVESTIPKDTSWHTAVLLRNSGVTQLYIDGVSAASISTGTTGGGRLVMGGLWYQSALRYPVSCSVGCTSLHLSALSDTDRALVEAWAAA